MLRRPIVWVLSAVLLVGVVFGGYWFQPWRLFTDTEVADEVPVVASGQPDAVVPADDAVPSGSASPSAAAVPPSPSNRLVASGRFITHEHETKGGVQLIRRPDGNHQLVLLGLSTSDGPDLRVWLTDQPVVNGTKGWKVFDDGRYLEVAPLKGNRGNQVYSLPAGTDPGDYRSVTIWCRRFAVSFGAAELKPA